MKGFVDERDRALIPIRVANKLRADMTEVVAWIDTAFDGHLFFSSWNCFHVRATAAQRFWSFSAI